MKKWLLFLLPFVLQCTQAPPIMQITYSLDLPGSVGVSSNLFFSDLTSSAEGTITTLTFTNDDGDVLQFMIAGLHAGATYNMTGSNSMTGTFNVVDPAGTLQAVQVENTEIGFINVNGLSGSASNITSMSGDFQINLQTAAPEGAAVGGTGSMTGVIGF